MYTDQTALVNSYGQDEIIQLTDRALDQTNTIDTTILNAKIEDAENEINQYLVCCFDLKSSAIVYQSSLGYACCHVLFQRWFSLRSLHSPVGVTADRQRIPYTAASGSQSLAMNFLK
jgi:phage gp36-like protein